MALPQEYYILAFDTTTSVMEAEAYIKNHFSITIMPVPREISKGCGLAIRFQNPEPDTILDFLKSSPLTCTLYRMATKKIDGKHPIEELLSIGKRA